MKRHRSIKGLYTEVAKHIGTLNELLFKSVEANISGVFPGADDWCSSSAGHQIKWHCPARIYGYALLTSLSGGKGGKGIWVGVSAPFALFPKAELKPMVIYRSTKLLNWAQFNGQNTLYSFNKNTKMQTCLSPEQNSLQTGILHIFFPWINSVTSSTDLIIIWEQTKVTDC